MTPRRSLARALVPALATLAGLAVPLGPPGIASPAAARSAASAISGAPHAAADAPLEMVGQLGGASWAVGVAGEVALLASGPRLHAFDVSDPAAPVAVGAGPILGDVIYGLAVERDRAYVAAGRGGLSILDVSDPAAIREVATLPLPGGAFDVAVSGGMAYVASGEVGLRVVDVADPAAPAAVGELPLALGESLDGYRVAAGGGLAVLALSSDSIDEPGEVMVVDVGTPAAPQVVSDGFGSAVDVALSGGLAFLVGGGGIEVYDLADSAEPREVDGWSGITSEAQTIDLSAGRAVLAGRGEVVVLDATELRAPVELDRFDPGWVQPDGFEERAAPAATGVAATPSGVVVVAESAGGYLVPRDGSTPAPLVGGLRVVDARDPEAVELGSVLRMPPLSAIDVALDGVAAFVTSGEEELDFESALWILDVAAPERPRVLGHALAGDDASPRAVAVAAGHAYVAHQQEGWLTTLDVREPSQPAVVDETGLSLYAVQRIAVDGRLAVAVGRDIDSPIQAFSLAWPARPIPVPIDDHEELSAGLDLAWSGGLAVTYDWQGLSLIDFRDPGRPRAVGRVPDITSDRVGGLAVAGGPLFAISDDRVHALDIAELASISVLDDLPMDAPAIAVAALGRHALALDRDGALHLLAVDDDGRLDDRATLPAPGWHRSVEAGLSAELGEIDAPGTIRVLGRHALVAHPVLGLFVVRLDDALLPAPEPVPTVPGVPLAHDIYLPYAARRTVTAHADRRLGVEWFTLRATPGERMGIAADAEHIYVGHLGHGDDAGVGRLAVYDSAAEEDDPPPVARSEDLGVVPSRIVRHGSAAYVMGRGGLRIVDLTDPLAPGPRGLVEPDRDLAAHAAAPFDRYVVLVEGDGDVEHDPSARGPGRLRVLDLSDAWEPIELDRVDVPGNPVAVAVAGGRAVVAAHGAGVHIYDLTDPTEPIRLATYGLQSVRDVAMDGGIAVAVTAGGFLDDDFLGLARSLALGPPGQEVALEPGGIWVLDVSSPDGRPREVGQHVAFGWPAGEGGSRVVLDGGIAYVGGYDSVCAYDVSDPTAPHPIDADEVGACGSDIAFGARDLDAAAGRLVGTSFEGEGVWRGGLVRRAESRFAR